MDDRDQTRERTPDALVPRPPNPPANPGEPATVLGVLAIALFVAAAKTHNPLFIVLAIALASVGAALFVRRAAPEWFAKLRGGPLATDRPHIGMGASIASDAVIEPGATVEMGASIGRGAVVRSGAVVRMGASVARGAVIESGAVVSWGADVQREARVGEKAVVGAGSTVKRGAQVPAGTRLFPGTDYGGVSGPAVMAPAPPPDLRAQRTKAVCDKLEAELAASPENLRDFLAGSGQTVASLRRTCDRLLARERSLRAEIDEGASATMEEERAAVQKRLDREPDEQIRMSLHGALAAMDEVKKQRELLRVGADRLQAEHTRLLYTLEALASQFVRLRSAGSDLRATADMEASVAQLRSELEAITDALEQVSRPMAALASPPPREDLAEPSATAPRGKERQ